MSHNSSRRKVVVIDTSVLCVWLRVPGKETCGPSSDIWTYDRADVELSKEKMNNSTLVLPIATIIETGNHIAQAISRRFEIGLKLRDIIKKTADEETPWAAFVEQNKLWTPEALVRLADDWVNHVAAGSSLGDRTIIDVVNYYSQAGFEVRILTGDQDLESYEPPKPPLVPRRRR